jgi:hypothetical protein
MKVKGYTLSHNVDLLKEIDNNGGQFTSDEKSFLMREEHEAGRYSSKKNLLRDLPKYTLGPRLSYFADLVRDNRFHSILSLGAGSCVQEYFLKMILPEGTKIVAADFDSYSINKAKEFFCDESEVGGGIIPMKFDFFDDNISDFVRKFAFDIDVVVFFASAYVMDDEKFVKLFREIGECGITRIVDFHAGYIDYKQYIMYLLKFFKNSIGLSANRYQGKFHGYFRSRTEIRSLYNQAGWIVDHETMVIGTKYVAVLSKQS